MIDTVVVLASGNGERMGHIGKTYAKCSIPVGTTIPIVRTLSYILESGLKNVIILAHERNISQIKEIIENNDFGETKVLCTTEFNSPMILESVHNVTTFLRGKPFYMILGDIFYLQNPFPKEEVSTNGDILYGTAIKNTREISKGGIIVTDMEGEITKISKSGIEIIEKGSRYYRWSGMALCKEGIDHDLQKLILSVKEGEKLFLESIFEYRKRNETKVSFIENSDFINLNTPSHLLLINLVLSSESMPYASLKTQKLIAQTTQSITNDIVDISAEQL